MGRKGRRGGKQTGGKQSGGNQTGGNQTGNACAACTEHKKVIHRLKGDLQSRDQAIEELSGNLQKAQTQVVGTTATLQEQREGANTLQDKLNKTSSDRAGLANQLRQESDRAELLATRIKDAEDEAGSLVQAEVAQRKVAVTVLEREARASCDAVLDNARQQASSQLEQAAVQAKQQLDEAITAAAKIRAEAQTEAAAARDTGNQEREEAIADATKRAEELLQKARDERDGIINTARTEAADLRGEATRQRHEWEAESKQVLETAVAEAAQVRRDADTDALREATTIKQEATTETERLRQARLAEIEAELLSRTTTLDEREATCRGETDDTAKRVADAERLEAEVARARSELEIRKRRCEEREAEFEAEYDQLATRRQALDEQESRIGAQRVERLEQELKEVNERLAEHRDLASERAAELMTLRQTLDAAGGGEALARTAELERLRERVATQNAQLATMHDDDRLQELKLEIERLKPYRERFQQLQQQRLQEENAAATADQRVIELREQLRDGQRERDTLADKLQLAEEKRDELQLVEQQSKNQRRDTEVLTIERDHLEVVNANLARELQAITGEVKNQAARHYGSLVRIDEQAEKGPPEKVAEETRTPRSLKLLANQLRKRMAVAGRYFDEHTVRTFLGSMAASRIILLKGISGTGKTSLPLFAADAMGAPRLRVPVQSSWRDRADLLGFYNAITKELNASKFTEAVYEACTPGYANRPNFLVLDEANLSRVEYYFADFLSELEDDTNDRHTVTLLDQAVGTQHPTFLEDGRELVVPPNTWFFLTANEDESTFEIADKTFDRASVMQLDIRATPFAANDVSLPPVSFEGLRKAFDKAAASFSMDEPKAFLDALEGVLKKELRIGYGNRFDTQLPAFAGVYVKAGGTPGPALDHFVRSKILRRLELVRDPGLKPAVQAVREVFDIWPYDPHHPEQCVELLDQVLQRLD